MTEFEKTMKKIIDTEKPDLIICTHAFPSYLVSNLKRNEVCGVPLLNIYTDFFINDVWGREMVDYHFVSGISMKKKLINNYQIPTGNIFVTGIPINESSWSTPFTQKKEGGLNIHSSSREKMNDLYNLADAIVSKPGV
jgi:processive 1,2-diacylglycerol beta-glucosyltransferase